MTAPSPPEYKCPFSAPLITRQFGCRHSQEVIHRGGAEINCMNQGAHTRCCELLACLKQVALPAFGVEDDLLSMPHSVQVKIQYGGLLGLQQHIGPASQMSERVEDIDSLVEAAHKQFTAGIPCSQFVEAITSFKPRARRAR